MKILIGIIFAVVLSGCYQTVNLRDIQDAVIICGGIDKITEIQSRFDGQEFVTCDNRLGYYIRADVLKGVK